VEFATDILDARAAMIFSGSIHDLYRICR